MQDAWGRATVLLFACLTAQVCIAKRCRIVNGGKQDGMVGEAVQKVSLLDQPPTLAHGAGGGRKTAEAGGPVSPEATLGAVCMDKSSAKSRRKEGPVRTGELERGGEYASQGQLGRT